MSVCLSFCDGCRVIQKVTNFLVKVNNKEEKMSPSTAHSVSKVGNYLHKNVQSVSSTSILDAHVPQLSKCLFVTWIP